MHTPLGYGGYYTSAIKTIQIFARIYEGADLNHDMNLLSDARTHTRGPHFQNRAGFTPTCYSSLPYTFPKISSIVNPLQCLFAPAVQKGIEREKINMPKNLAESLCSGTCTFLLSHRYDYFSSTSQ